MQVESAERRSEIWRKGLLGRHWLLLVLWVGHGACRLLLLQVPTLWPEKDKDTRVAGLRHGVEKVTKRVGVMSYVRGVEDCRLGLRQTREV
jgi:hypothetical protein